MLKYRILTAMILIPLLLLGLFQAPAAWLGALGIVVFLLCGYEWLALIPETRLFMQLVFMGTLLVSLQLAIHWFLLYQWTSALLWTGILLAILSYPRRQACWHFTALLSFTGLVLLPTAAISLAHLYAEPHGKAQVFYLLLLVWAADTGAYAAGKGFGRHKLIPHVSPGKTIEGMIGGLISALAVAWGASCYFHPTTHSTFFIQALATILMAMVGDLAISLFKRRVTLKDTGTLLPGHGGFLDRLDSLLAAAFIFVWLT